MSSFLSRLLVGSAVLALLSSLAEDGAGQVADRVIAGRDTDGQASLLPNHLEPLHSTPYTP